jgi:hypothetical protein
MTTILLTKHFCQGEIASLKLAMCEVYAHFSAHLINKNYVFHDVIVGCPECLKGMCNLLVFYDLWFGWLSDI